MSENDDFKARLKDYVKKNFYLTLKLVEQEYGLDRIYDYVKEQKSELRKKSKTGNTKYTIAGKYYILTAVGHYRHNRAVEKIAEDFNYSNVSGVESNLQNFKKAVLKEYENERMHFDFISTVDKLTRQVLSTYDDYQDEFCFNLVSRAISDDLIKWGIMPF